MCRYRDKQISVSDIEQQRVNKMYGELIPSDTCDND